MEAFVQEKGDSAVQLVSARDLEVKIIRESGNNESSKSSAPIF